jgi:hypothetical protein
MRLKNLYKALKYALGGLFFLLLAGFLFSSLLEVDTGDLEESLEDIPNYNYVQDIRGLKKEGKLNEAIEMARFVIQHQDMPADLNIIEKTAEKNVYAAYFTVKNGGAQGVDILKRFDATDAGINIMNKAAKKGPNGVTWLSRDGGGYKYIIRTRITARLLKNIKLGRPQQFITRIATEIPNIKILLWAVTIVTVFLSLFLFVEAGRKLRKAVKL